MVVARKAWVPCGLNCERRLTLENTKHRQSALKEQPQSTKAAMRTKTEMFRRIKTTNVEQVPNIKLRHNTHKVFILEFMT